jgi:hypothetical protein
MQKWRRSSRVNIAIDKSERLLSIGCRRSASIQRQALRRDAGWSTPASTAAAAPGDVIRPHSYQHASQGTGTPMDLSRAVASSFPRFTVDRREDAPFRLVPPSAQRGPGWTGARGQSPSLNGVGISEVDGKQTNLGVGQTGRFWASSLSRRYGEPETFPSSIQPCCLIGVDADQPDGHASSHSGVIPNRSWAPHEMLGRHCARASRDTT